jgi:hypothetical protein
VQNILTVTRSSGVVADGGDFDATKPGAGAEANRKRPIVFIHSDMSYVLTLK